MSTGVFEGLAGAVGQQPRQESYTPGEPAFDMALVDRIVDDWLAIPSQPWKPRSGRAVITPARDETKAHLKMLKSAGGEGFDANLFLENLIERFFSQSGCHSLSPDDIGYELDCLVQAFYTLGHNKFALTIPESEHFFGTSYSVGYRLRGSSGRPLVASYRAPRFRLAGCGVHHCKLEFHGRVLRGGGGGAKHSEVRCHGPTENVQGPANNCSYYVQQSDCLFNDSAYSPQGCSYYISGGITDAEKERLKWEFPSGGITSLFGLSRKRNRFYVPDGAGKWEEVRL